MKDNFSTQAKQYAQFRPTYPQALYDFIYQEIKSTELAWDCATGNGQVAVELAKKFAQVYATDISEKQLANAPQLSNVTYQVERAEATHFENECFDLITVAQAIHWFDFDKFFGEVKRTLKPDGLFVAIGYDLMKIDEEIDALIYHLYDAILGKYWDEERRHIEQAYRTIPFPLKEINCPELVILTEWNFDQLIGYLNTWSSLQHYLKTHQQNPIEFIINDLKSAWGSAATKKVRFPLILKAGRV